MSKLTLVVMAAGMGSRFGGLKQIEPVGPSGEIIIDYNIYDAIENGFEKVVFIIKEEFLNLFKEVIGDKISSKVEVAYVFQKNDNVPSHYHFPISRTKPLGTGHAILCAKDEVEGNFAVINADDYYGKDAISKMANYLKQLNNTNKECKDYALVGYHIANTLTAYGVVSRGVCEVQNNELISLTESEIKQREGKIIADPHDTLEEFEVSEDTLVSMNLFGFSKDFFNSLEEHFHDFLEQHKENLLTCEFQLPTVVKQDMQKNKAKVEIISTDSRWYGVTYHEDKDIVVNAIHKMVEEGIYPNKI